MDPIAIEDLGPAVVHSHGNGDDKRAARVSQTLVDVGLEVYFLRDVIELSTAVR